MINIIIQWLNLYARRRSYRSAVKAAIKEHTATKRKVFVVLNQGEFVALTKKKLKQLHAAKQISHEALKNIEKIAVFTAA